ncbi:MAG TPA: hypothetical protein VMU84_15900, partial [Thermoanaerobaculia bacterium]|nr:hypothetical protein [Thermoanaerobaculia bacterium]
AISDGESAAWISGYLNLYGARFDADTAAPVANARYLELYNTLMGKPRIDVMAFLSAGWIVADRKLDKPMQLVAHTRRVAVYRNPLALPMATFWAHAIETKTDNEAFHALMQLPEGGLRVTPHANAELANAPHTIVPARIDELGLSHVRVTVDAPHDGIVVLGQQDARGWRVAVDGTPREKLIAHGVFRAVAVSAGHHEIVWTYHPRSFFYGALMTIITLVSLQVRVFVKRAR